VLPPDALFKSDGSGTDCTQGSPCSLQTALVQAADGETIYVATGTCPGTGAVVITITQSITLYGGWDGTATTPVVRDPDAYPTTLDGENARRGMYISGNTVSSNTAGSYCGGLCLLYSDNATLTGNTIADNTAGNHGGGLFIYRRSPTLINNIIADNRANESGSGLYIWDA